MEMIKIIEVAQDVISSLVLVLTGLIGISLLIPGEQPEKALQAVLDFIKKFSKK
jgi:hypothetical protein